MNMVKKWDLTYKLKHEQAGSSKCCRIGLCHLSGCCTCFWGNPTFQPWSPGWRTDGSRLWQSRSWSDHALSGCWGCSTRWCRSSWEWCVPQTSGPGCSGRRSPAPRSDTPWWPRRRALCCTWTTVCPSRCHLPSSPDDVYTHTHTPAEAWAICMSSIYSRASTMIINVPFFFRRLW